MTYESALARISALVKAKRREKKLGLRAAASECGLSPSTLSRLERGASSSLPDADTLAKLANWLEVSVGFLLLEQGKEGDEDGPELTTPEVVEVHLRADKRLSPKTAEALAEMFRILYEQFTQEPRV
ncbi:helix-turn-helix domain-containing protein [Phormidium nigroviride]